MPCPAATPYPSERNPLDPAGSVLRFFPPLHALGIDLFLHQQALDTTTPAGRRDMTQNSLLDHMD
jgi:hypothetical protein